MVVVIQDSDDISLLWAVLIDQRSHTSAPLTLKTNSEVDRVMPHLADEEMRSKEIKTCIQSLIVSKFGT